MSGGYLDRVIGRASASDAHPRPVSPYERPRIASLGTPPGETENVDEMTRASHHGDVGAQTLDDAQRLGTPDAFLAYRGSSSRLAEASVVRPIRASSASAKWPRQERAAAFDDASTGHVAGIHTAGGPRTPRPAAGLPDEASTASPRLPSTHDRGTTAFAAPARIDADDAEPSQLVAPPRPRPRGTTADSAAEDAGMLRPRVPAEWPTTGVTHTRAPAGVRQSAGPTATNVAPTIVVTIGRVEVRAAVIAPPARAVSAPAPMSLDAFLARRAGERR
jgi:hypothetical protein